MRITITEAEIKTAIVNHIQAQGFNLSGKNVEIDLKATRGPEGYSADIDITDASAKDASAVPAATLTRSATPAAAAEITETPAAEVVAEETPEDSTPANDAEESTPAPKKSIFAKSEDAKAA